MYYERVSAEYYFLNQNEANHIEISVVAQRIAYATLRARNDSFCVSTTHRDEHEVSHSVKATEHGQIEVTPPGKITVF